MSGVDGGGWTTAFAPASVSNVGPGFDSFGFALQTPGDTVSVRRTDEPGVHITKLDDGGGQLPTDPARNTAAVAAHALWHRIGPALGDAGLEMHIVKGLPAGTGLGSSAASAVAAAVATTGLIGTITGAAPSQEETLAAAIAGEAAIAGAPHADNAAPSLLGGFTIVQSVAPPVVARFQPVLACRVAVVTPHLVIETKAARALLPEQVPLSLAVQNWSNAAALVAGLLTNDSALVARSMRDTLIEPLRSCRIPGFEEARDAAVDAGAWTAALSGSGPTVFALAADNDTAEAAADAMTRVFAGHDLDSTRGVTGICPHGARIT